MDGRESLLPSPSHPPVSGQCLPMAIPNQQPETKGACWCCPEGSASEQRAEWRRAERRCHSFAYSTGTYWELLDRLIIWPKCECESHSVMSDSLQPHDIPWHSPGQNPGVGSHSLPQGIFPTWGPNPGLPHCRQILYQLSHQGSPRILERVAYPFSSGSSQPRNQIWVSNVAVYQ